MCSLTFFAADPSFIKLHKFFFRSGRHGMLTVLCNCKQQATYISVSHYSVLHIVIIVEFFFSSAIALVTDNLFSFDSTVLHCGSHEKYINSSRNISFVSFNDNFTSFIYLFLFSFFFYLPQTFCALCGLFIFHLDLHKLVVSSIFTFFFFLSLPFSFNHLYIYWDFRFRIAIGC